MLTNLLGVLRRQGLLWQAAFESHSIAWFDLLFFPPLPPTITSQRAQCTVDYHLENFSFFLIPSTRTTFDPREPPFNSSRFHVIKKRHVFEILNHRAIVSPLAMYVYNSALGARLSIEYGSLSSESRHQSDLNAVGTISIIMITTMFHRQRQQRSYFFSAWIYSLFFVFIFHSH